MRGLPFAFAYIDDVLITSHDMKEYQDHMNQVFERLVHFGLKINTNKCDFAVSKLNFLGHVIDEQGITHVPDKVAAIQNFPQPTSLRQRRFLGLINVIEIITQANDRAFNVKANRIKLLTTGIAFVSTVREKKKKRGTRICVFHIYLSH